MQYQRSLFGKSTHVTPPLYSPMQLVLHGSTIVYYNMNLKGHFMVFFHVLWGMFQKQSIAHEMYSTNWAHFFWLVLQWLNTDIVNEDSMCSCISSSNEKLLHHIKIDFSYTKEKYSALTALFIFFQMYNININGVINKKVSAKAQQACNIS